MLYGEHDMPPGGGDPPEAFEEELGSVTEEFVRETTDMALDEHTDCLYIVAERLHPIIEDWHRLKEENRKMGLALALYWKEALDDIKDQTARKETTVNPHSATLVDRFDNDTLILVPSTDDDPALYLIAEHNGFVPIRVHPECTNVEQAIEWSCAGAWPGKDDEIVEKEFDTQVPYTQAIDIACEVLDKTNPPFDVLFNENYDGRQYIEGPLLITMTGKRRHAEDMEKFCHEVMDAYLHDTDPHGVTVSGGAGGAGDDEWVEYTHTFIDAPYNICATIIDQVKTEVFGVDPIIKGKLGMFGRGRAPNGTNMTLRCRKKDLEKADQLVHKTMYHLYKRIGHGGICISNENPLPGVLEAAEYVKENADKLTNLKPTCDCDMKWILQGGSHTCGL